VAEVDEDDDVATTVALCEQLGRVPGWTWREDGDPYTEADGVGIYYGPIGATPHRAIGVRIYGWTDPRVDPSSRRVQLRLRGLPNDLTGADRMAGIAKAVIQSLSRVAGISGASRISASPSDADGNGRQERTDSYIITLDNPEAST
jgi:hypothetical protein